MKQRRRVVHLQLRCGEFRGHRRAETAIGVWPASTTIRDCLRACQNILILRTVQMVTLINTMLRVSITRTVPRVTLVRTVPRVPLIQTVLRVTLIKTVLRVTLNCLAPPKTEIEPMHELFIYKMVVFLSWFIHLLIKIGCLSIN